jgi:hypothetical protein
MRKSTRKIAMWFAGAVVVVCCFALNASAQTGGQPKPVRFERGRTTAILKGTADNAHGLTYILAAKKGQTMTVHVTARGGAAIFSITAPGGPIEDALEVKDWTGELPDTGNYLIAVWNGKKRGAALPYTLELAIR